MEVDFLRYEYKKKPSDLMAPFIIFRRECPIPTDGGMNRLDINHATCPRSFLIRQADGRTNEKQSSLKDVSPVLSCVSVASVQVMVQFPETLAVLDSILDLSVTDDMLKLPISRLVRLEQSPNIYCIFVTLSVLKLPTSRLVRLEQPLNIESIFTTLPVLKLPTSKLVRLEQPLNIYRISVTLPVLKPPTSRLVRLEQL